MIKVSVIVPVYNVENYLKECLDSIINQTLKDIEIICVDDCSTDNSYSILEEYAKEDNRIKLFKNIENMGVGYTRNVALQNSSAKYIYFIDPDDYIDLDYIEQLYKTAEKYNSDIVSNLNILKVENTKTSYFLPFSASVMKKMPLEGKSSVSILDEKEGSKEYLFDALWNSIYRRDFIFNNNLFFLNIKARNGDTDYYFRLLANNPSTAYNHKSRYYYRIHSSSIVQQAQGNPEYNIKALEHFYNSIEYYKSNCPEYLNILYKKCWQYVFNLFRQSHFSSYFYDSIHKFSKDIYLNSCDHLLEYDRRIFLEYSLIKNNKTYTDYVFNKLMLESDEYYNQIQIIKNDIAERGNWFRLFGLKKTKDSFILILFGIRITIKK